MLGKALTLLMAGLVGAAPAAAASDAGPRAVVEDAIVRILNIVRDGAVDGVRITNRAAAMRQIDRGLFDFEDISRRALARHWQSRTPQEQAEFIVLFRDVLERSYLGMLNGYHGEQIRFVGETVEGDVATVRARIVTSRREIAVDFRLHSRAGRWLVYDVLVGGFSFIDSFRSQFDHVIKAESYGSLCARLRARRLDDPVADRSQS